MRWWLILLGACGLGVDAPPELLSARSAMRPPPMRVDVDEPTPVTHPVGVAAAAGDRSEDDRDLDAPFEVKGWLEDASRCGRHGRRRFCNGPRRVPEPYGHAKQLAESLELGSHRAAAEMIRTRPRDEWVAHLRNAGIEPPAYPLVWPVDDGRFGRGLTWRGRRITHRGVDVSAEDGTPVRAVADALVGYADNTVRGYGNLLVLVHGGGEVSSYAHLSAVHVFPGQRVQAGQVVALAGNTGISRGPHLHFEWRENGELADPMRRFPTAVVPAWMQAEFKSED